MLSLASFPPDRQEIERWFADHPRQWEAGYACRFAVMLEGEMVGLVDVDGIGQGEGIELVVFFLLQLADALVVAPVHEIDPTRHVHDAAGQVDE